VDGGTIIISAWTVAALLAGRRVVLFDFLHDLKVWIFVVAGIPQEKRFFAIRH
jgi:hypothetical protein